ncbi:hypothetical protein IF1G_09086 [Cordyceps javanica]|uniref:Uncharacterized protein n=1 Tax=Cordyceps javanica TaxID=43265 RepID=A0A545URC5_9HYPO|nr:hypothetical protein IF1G_09086 [Cordyceps javanica]
MLELTNWTRKKIVSVVYICVDLFASFFFHHCLDSPMYKCDGMRRTCYCHLGLTGKYVDNLTSYDATKPMR